MHALRSHEEIDARPHEKIRGRAQDEIRDVNTRYHDAAAAGYDAKWGIDFGDTGRNQVLGKLRRLLGETDGIHFPCALEIGCGTGYFGLNLALAGVVGELTCTDISTGMVNVLNGNAARLGLSPRVRALRAAATALPFAQASFDVVVGHAVLHHIPDLDAAFSELMRVLRPGGRVLFAGEPSRLGDLLARVPKRAARIAAPAWRTLLRAAPAPAPTPADGSRPHTHPAHTLDGPAHTLDGPAHTLDGPAHTLESRVDIHTFRPAELAQIAARAGFADIRVCGEELLANWFGWFNRGLEASAAVQDVPMRWRRYAFEGYLALQKLDRRVLEPRLPTAIFYNLLLSARRP